MPIEEPKIHVALAINGERVTLMVSRGDGCGLPSRMNWDLHDIEHEGYLALCQRVGATVTRMLAGAHPELHPKSRNLRAACYATARRFIDNGVELAP